MKDIETEIPDERILRKPGGGTPSSTAGEDARRGEHSEPPDDASADSRHQARNRPSIRPYSAEVVDRPHDRTFGGPVSRPWGPFPPDPSIGGWTAGAVPDIVRDPSRRGSTSRSKPAPPSTVMALHYPRKTSRIKKIRKSGFRARMATKAGRKIINGRRRSGRKRLTTI